MDTKGERFAQAVLLFLEVFKNILVILVCLVVLYGVVRGYFYVRETSEQLEQWGATVGDLYGE
jgi:uncharacterized membrane protein